MFLRTIFPSHFIFSRPATSACPLNTDHANGQKLNLPASPGFDSSQSTDLPKTKDPNILMSTDHPYDNVKLYNLTVERDLPTVRKTYNQEH